MALIRVYILMGPPGSGKGTQSKKLAQTSGLAHISSGDLFRENIKLGTPLGDKATAYLKVGQLVPDDLVISMISDRIKEADCSKGFIVDGFPRTVQQAQSFEDLLTKIKAERLVFELVVPDDEVITRLTSRITCSACGAPFKATEASSIDSPCPFCRGKLTVRADDTREVIQQRLASYHKETLPLSEYYASLGALRKIDGRLSEKAVFLSIQEFLS